MPLTNMLSISNFLQALQEPALLLDATEKILQVNTSLSTLFGYAQEELEQQPFEYLCSNQNNISKVSLDWNLSSSKIQEWLFYAKSGAALSLRCSQQTFEQTTNGILHLVLLIPRTKQPPLHDYLAKAEAQLETTLNYRERDLQQALERLQQHQLDLEQEILERQAMEQQLLVAKAKIQSALDRSQELSDLKTRFIATASHEFRTPLSSILSSAALIERYTTTEQQPKRLKHVHRIKSSVKNLTHILEDFLSLSSLEEGKVQQHQQQFNLEELFQSILGEVKVMAKAQQQFELRQEQKPIVLQTNLQALKNILLNLLSNAIKYSPDNALIKIHSQVQEDQVTIQVEDNGMGIPPTQQKHLFTRFFRADNATAIQGTGLGLYIVKKYLESIQGNISFESVEGEGTTFTIQFPKNSQYEENLSH
ncbi:MAG: PAS domain-containing sensor histidine kinase [Aureispira sp.]